jgi:hypothetical protein
VFNQGFYSLSLQYKGNPLTSTTDFKVHDCIGIDRCGLCVISPDCGWCRGVAGCETEAWCNTEPFTAWGTTCPRIRQLNPQLGSVGGGTAVSIRGQLFANVPGLIVRIESSPGGPFVDVNATYVSDEEITFVTPASTTGASAVSVTVWLNGKPYVDIDDALTYNYVVDGTPPGVAAGISAAAAAVAAAAVGALIYMRKKKVGFFNEFKLREPNYAEIAFGNYLQRTLLLNPSFFVRVP